MVYVGTLLKRRALRVGGTSMDFKLFIQGFQTLHPRVSSYSSKHLDVKLFIPGFGFQTIHPRIWISNYSSKDSISKSLTRGFRCKYPVYQNNCGESRMHIPFAMSIFPESLIFPFLPFLGRIQYFYDFHPENVNFRGQYLKKMN